MASVYIGNTYAHADESSQAATTLLTEEIKNKSQGQGWSSGNEGLYQDENGDYRYVGANPNNWVIFNDDRYQIIGMFNKNTHGLDGYRVKLIRAKPIGAYAWGVYNDSNTSGTYSNYSANWTGKGQSTPANLYVLLNEYFYNKKDTSDTYGNCNDWTYFSSNLRKTQNCDVIVDYGIKSEYQNYIESEATWYLYGILSTNLEVQRRDMYECERGSGDCTSANSGASDTSITAPIGLMYPTDYLYATNNYADSNNAHKLVENNYGISNWLYMGYEWTITPTTDEQIALRVEYNSSINKNYTCFANLVRPTFYLKSDVYVKSGDGSYNNPYVLTLS